MTWATQFSTMGGPVGDPWTWAYPLHCMCPFPHIAAILCALLWIVGKTGKLYTCAFWNLNVLNDQGRIVRLSLSLWCYCNAHFQRDENFILLYFVFWSSKQILPWQYLGPNMSHMSMSYAQIVAIGWHKQVEAEAELRGWQGFRGWARIRSHAETTDHSRKLASALMCRSRRSGHVTRSSAWLIPHIFKDNKP